MSCATAGSTVRSFTPSDWKCAITNLAKKKTNKTRKYQFFLRRCRYKIGCRCFATKKKSNLSNSGWPPLCFFYTSRVTRKMKLSDCDEHSARHSLQKVESAPSLPSTIRITDTHTLRENQMKEHQTVRVKMLPTLDHLQQYGSTITRVHSEVHSQTHPSPKIHSRTDSARKHPNLHQKCGQCQSRHRLKQTFTHTLEMHRATHFQHAQTHLFNCATWKASRSTVRFIVSSHFRGMELCSHVSHSRNNTTYNGKMTAQCEPSN